MPIQDYYGNTYVGFLDISGFKELMKNRETARDTLDKFYKTIYYAVDQANFQELDNSIKLNSIVVSDCAVLFLSGPQDQRNENYQNIPQKEGLEKMLSFVQKINRESISGNLPFMTTCSIAYGDFEYRSKYEREYLTKNCIIGDAYLNAFLDNENGKPKMQPGECRILKQNLANITQQGEIFSLTISRGPYYYFYWMLENANQRELFERESQDTYQLRYKGMISLLQKYANRQREV